MKVMNVLEAIKIRRSVRNYNGKPLDKDLIYKLKDAIDKSYTLFGVNVNIKLKL